MGWGGRYQEYGPVRRHVHVLWSLVAFRDSTPAWWLPTGGRTRVGLVLTKCGRHSALIASGVPPTLHRRQAILGMLEANT